MDSHKLMMARQLLASQPMQTHANDPRKVNTCQMDPEEIAERDRPKSRQERRQIERLRKKGRPQ